MSEISIIVPVYNVAKYLARCLDSLQNQTFKDIEIICVDDGSTDNSGQILDKYAQNDSRIKVIHQTNGGLSCARNSGIKIANGRYISFVDSDDWVDKDFIEKLYDAIIRNDADIAAASIIRKREHNEKFRVHYTAENCFETLAEKIAACSLPKCCYVWNKLYKKEIIADWQFKAGVYFEDVLWMPEVLKKSKKLVSVPSVNYYYWANPGSTVKQKQSAKKISDRIDSKRHIIKFFEENNLPLSKQDKTLIKKIVYLGKIPVLKVKEYENWETFYLLGFLPVLKVSDSDNRICYNVFGLRFLIRKNKISPQELKNLNSKYENSDTDSVYPKVKTKEETLKELIESDKSITRFGDGEFNLIWGESLPFQEFSGKLQTRLKEILIADNENLLVAIPDVFGSLQVYNDGAANFWRKFVVANRERLYKILNLDKQYFDTETTRPYMDLADKSKVGEYFKDFKKVWNNKNVVFVEGEMSRLGFGNDLFDNCKTIKRIICPARSAFKFYDKILEECKKLPGDTLFIIALGPTATVLAYDLSQMGYRALDLGHIDIEYEWFLQKATKKVAIKNKYVNEVKKGRISSDLNNEKYLSEIIKTIK